MRWSGEASTRPCTCGREGYGAKVRPCVHACASGARMGFGFPVLNAGRGSTVALTLWVWATVRPSTALRARSSRARPRRLAPRAGGRRPERGWFGTGKEVLNGGREGPCAPHLQDCPTPHPLPYSPAAPSIPAPPRSVPSAADGTLPAAPCVVFLLRRESASVTQRWRCAGPPRAEWPNLAAASPPPGLPCAGPEAPRRQSTRGAGTGHSHPGRSQPAPPQPAPRDPGPALYPAMHSALHPCLNPALNSACLYPALNSALNSCLARASCRGPAVSSWGGPRRQAAPGRLGSPAPAHKGWGHGVGGMPHRRGHSCRSRGKHFAVGHSGAVGVGPLPTGTREAAGSSARGLARAAASPAGARAVRHCRGSLRSRCRARLLQQRLHPVGHWRRVHRVVHHHRPRGPRRRRKGRERGGHRHGRRRRVADGDRHRPCGRPVRVLHGSTAWMFFNSLRSSRSAALFSLNFKMFQKEKGAWCFLFNILLKYKRHLPEQGPPRSLKIKILYCIPRVGVPEFLFPLNASGTSSAAVALYQNQTFRPSAVGLCRRAVTCMQGWGGDAGLVDGVGYLWPCTGSPRPCGGLSSVAPRAPHYEKKKLKKTGRERAVLGARRQRPAAAARARRRPATGHRAASGLRATRAVANLAMARRQCLAATVPAGAAEPSRTR
eukprot:scaffold14071_cov105-Isochrysis_galbana.AAC.5